jgi:salicylate hydroxylase
MRAARAWPAGGDRARRLGPEIQLWSTGQSWKLFDLGAVSVELYGFPYVFMHRRDLHGKLVQGIRRLKLDALHLGMRCVAVPI